MNSSSDYDRGGRLQRHDGRGPPPYRGRRDDYRQHRGDGGHRGHGHGHDGLPRSVPYWGPDYFESCGGYWLRTLRKAYNHNFCYDEPDELSLDRRMRCLKMRDAGRQEMKVIKWNASISSIRSHENKSYINIDEERTHIYYTQDEFQSMEQDYDTELADTRISIFNRRTTTERCTNKNSSIGDRTRNAVAQAHRTNCAAFAAAAALLSEQKKGNGNNYNNNNKENLYSSEFSKQKNQSDNYDSNNTNTNDNG